MGESEARTGWGGELSPEESARLSGHLAGAAASGLPPGPGLRALAEESPRGAFRAALIGLADAVERGEPLDRAVEGKAGRIPAGLRGLIRAGIRAGDPGEVLVRFSAVARAESDLRRSFRTRLAYPALAVALTLGLFLLMDVMVVERFRLIFADFGISLPAMTRVLIAASGALRAMAPALVVIGLAGIVAWLILRVVAPRAVRNGILLRIPILGTLWRHASRAEFCHLLSMLVEARIPLPEALRLTGEALENRTYDRACAAMASEVERGASLSDAMASDARGIRRMIPDGLPGLLRWAEDRGATAEVLRMAGETFQAQSRAGADFAAAALAVLAALPAIAGLGLVTVGLFLPLITLVSVLSG